jgi:phosphoribosylglycinamide formyltransferase 1
VSAKVRVGALVSGRGTNLAALCKAGASPDFPAEIVLVLANRADAKALDVARSWGVDAEAFPVSAYAGDGRARDRAMRDRLRLAHAELVVCAGYNRVLSDEFLGAFPDAILNVHPSLLPAFGGGMHAVEDALAYGVKLAGCTVQLLEPGIPDGGPIIVQAAVPVHEDDDAESLRQRIHEQEWKLVPEAVTLWCQGRIQRDGRVVRISAPREHATG